MSGSTPSLSATPPARSSAMGDAKGGLKLKIADVLSMIGDKKAQQAIADAALASNGAEMVSLVNSATASAKRFGNMLEERQVKRLLEAAGKTTAGRRERPLRPAGSLEPAERPGRSADHGQVISYQTQSKEAGTTRCPAFSICMLLVRHRAVGSFHVQCRYVLVELTHRLVQAFAVAALVLSSSSSFSLVLPRRVENVA